MDKFIYSFLPSIVIDLNSNNIEQLFYNNTLLDPSKKANSNKLLYKFNK